MNRLSVFGAGGHGKVAASIAELMGYQDIHFYDDNTASKTEFPWPYMGSYSDFLVNSKDSDVFIAVGNCEVREKLGQEALNENLRLVNLVHPSSIISSYSTLGKGVMVVAGAIINPFCELGDGVIINTGATIGHDCYIHSYSHIAPGVSMAGHCIVKSKAWIGINSSLIQGVAIGEGTIVGAGSVVVDDIGDRLIAYGNPARIKNT